ncbi:MAG: acyl-CoA dehydrogenase [Pseudomonadota bacterium]
MSEIVNREDLDFLLYDVLKTEQLLKTDRYAAYDRDAITAILDTAQNIAEDLYWPDAAAIDAEEPRFENGAAITHPSIKPALAAYAEAGLFSAGFDEDIGGMQLPMIVQTAANGIFSCANISIQGYALLTAGAANMLNAFGSDAQKAAYLPPMMEGRWFGTMCLSEPHAGSSLADIRTKAAPLGNGRYAIKGAKMWISGGEQDISENIVHMVLAKIPDGPPGVKGISLFIVPKFRLTPDGEIGAANNISLAGLNHKMGYRGTTNTLLNFGDDGECEGWLVGEPHQGLRYMFHMMNEARIGVGHGATMLGLAGYLHSLQYAKERPQGRQPDNKDPNTPQIPIIEHADIKRLLLTQKAYVEGAMGLVLYCAQLVDQAAISSDEAEQKRLGLLLDLLTPIAKSWPSEYCLEANKHAIQILGGYGYTRDYPVERFYRDNRLNPIHEGAHGIHGIDILGRKVRMHNGGAVLALREEMQSTIAEAEGIDELSNEAAALRQSLDTIAATIQSIVSAQDPQRELANGTLFLDAFGHVVIAWIWLMQGVAAKKRAERKTASAFTDGKLRAMRFFFRYELPKTDLAFSLASRMDQTFAQAQADEFTGSA